MSDNDDEKWEYKRKLPFCKVLYNVPLFPQSVKTGLPFYVGLLLCTMTIVLYSIQRVRKQRQLLRRGEIKAMKEWLLPVYMKFLYFFTAVYCVRALDIAIVFIAFRSKLQSGMPTSVALFHAACFWTSEFWLFDSLMFFLFGDNHGTAAIKRSFWASTLIWLVSAAVITQGIRDAHAHSFWNFVAVFAMQCTIISLIACSMLLFPKPHHRHLWPLLVCQFVGTVLRLLSDAYRAQKINAFCLMDLSDYISGILLPWLIVWTLRADSEHWSAVHVDMITRNRQSIYGAMAAKVKGSDRPSMSAWSELLSQHTKILPANMLIPVRTQQSASMVGGSGRVLKARYKSKTVAIKEWRFERFTHQVIALWTKEALISSNFRHRNVVSLVGICIEPPSIKIVMEWCRYGSLRRYLTTRKPISWRLRYKFICDVAEGMVHLHRNGLVHRDLKTLNLLIDEDNVPDFVGILGRDSSPISSDPRFPVAREAQTVSLKKPKAKKFRPKGGEKLKTYIVKICDFGSSRSVEFRKYYDGSEEPQSSFPSIFGSGGSKSLSTSLKSSKTKKRRTPLAMQPLREPSAGRQTADAMRFQPKYLATPIRTPTSGRSIAGGKDKDPLLLSSDKDSKDTATGPMATMSRFVGKLKSAVGMGSGERMFDSMENEMEGSVDSVTYMTRTGGVLPSDESLAESSEMKEDSLADSANLALAPDMLMDFSLTSALLHEISASMSTIVGSVQFLPPEILKNIEFKEGSRRATSKCRSHYGFSADVYSFGCVLWEIMTQREIYKGRSYLSIQKEVLSGEREAVADSDLAECPDSKFLTDLMASCWAQDSARRPNFPQILQALSKHKHNFGY